MSYWNGTRWGPDSAVTPRPTPTSRSRRRRLPSFTILLGLLLLPVLALGTSRTLTDTDQVAGRASVTVASVGVPGQLVTIDGRGFKAHQVYQVRWDSLATPIRLVWPNTAGRFHGRLRIPAGVANGSHVLTFSPVSHAAAVRIAKGKMKMSALPRTPSTTHVLVRVQRAHSTPSTGRPFAAPVTSRR